MKAHTEGVLTMKHVFAIVAVLLLMAACKHAPSTRLVYSGGFSFANYDYLIVAKPDPRNTSTSLYGMDVEFANLMSRYNMKVVGDKEYEKLSPENQKRTLIARLSLVADGKDNLISVSFDDAPTGRTGASITSRAKGNIFNLRDRTKAIESLSKTITKALKQDKGLKISDERTVTESVVQPKSQ